MSRRFPRSPGTDRENPFEDGRGENPFGDEGPTPPTDQDPYQAPADAGPRSYLPDDFETIYPNRSWLILSLGVGGLLMVIAGVSVSMIAAVVASWWGAGMIYGVPMSLIGLTFSLPAWGLGHSDRKAMRAGAMETAGRRGTNIGYRLGIVGTILGTVPLTAFVVGMIVAVFR